MATAMAVQPLAPRPCSRDIAAWSPPKQRLMDNNESRPALKQLQQSAPQRPRRERPCDGCRRRKSKCVLQEGRRCVLCEFHKQDCTFVENAQPRKRKVDDTNKSDTSPNKRSAASSVKASTPPATKPQQPIFDLSNIPAPAPPVQPAGTKVLSVVDESLSLQRHRHCRYVGQTTALDARLIGLGDFNETNETESQVGLLRQVTGTEYFSTHDDADVPMPDDEARALADIERIVGPHGNKLIEIYFRNVHPSFPIIQKQAFLDRHRHGDRQFNPPLLAAMYLLALGWWQQEPTLASQPRPDIARLEYIAITSLTMAMQRPKISAVQAGLLLLQRPKSSTWTLTVQLVALGQDIGLHLDCSNWSIPLWERRLRKRLAWALYMQDKWSAVGHGRPSHISAADWNVPTPVPDDFDESVPPIDSTTDEEDEETLRGRSLFNQMITLTSIMAEVCDTFYSQTAKADIDRAGKYATQLVLNRAKPVQIRLKEWFAKLPAECKMDSYNTNQLSATGYLHLAYFATEISIHRRIVQSLRPPTTPSESYMMYICRSAAKTRLISAMDFVNRLRPEHLSAFWYFASASNFALIGTFGALLQATSPGSEEAAFYAARLNEFKWTLSVSAGKAPWIQGALELLDATATMLTRLPSKPASVADEEGMDEELMMTGFGVGAVRQEMEVDRW
ncbi:hypothetical protein WHR41_01159 [Cladosporium halotolerans]|uniref:Zn(2)-C6 fungal-type domain-containing protein n=1 Tax=Cladosporium halotolerans TaxID=1052096 RepID=A0AB34KZL5_9PEZI